MRGTLLILFLGLYSTQIFALNGIWGRSDLYDHQCQPYENFKKNKKNKEWVYGAESMRCQQRQSHQDGVAAKTLGFLTVLGEQAVEAGDCSAFLYSTYNEIEYDDNHPQLFSTTPVCECFTCTEHGVRTAFSEMLVRGKHERKAKKIIEEKIGEYFRGQIYTMINNAIYVDNLIKQGGCGAANITADVIEKVKSCRVEAILKTLEQRPKGCDASTYQRKLKILLGTSGNTYGNTRHRNHQASRHAHSFKNSHVIEFYDKLKEITVGPLHNRIPPHMTRNPEQDTSKMCVPYKAFIAMTTPPPGRQHFMNGAWTPEDRLNQLHSMRANALIAKLDFKTFKKRYRYLVGGGRSHSDEALRREYDDIKRMHEIEKDILSRDPFLQISLQSDELYSGLYSHARQGNFLSDDLEGHYCRVDTSVTPNTQPVIDQLLATQEGFCSTFRGGTRSRSEENMNPIQKEFLCNDKLPTFSPEFFNSHLNPAIKKHFGKKGERIAKYIQRRNFCKVDRKKRNVYKPLEVTEETQDMQRMLNPDVISENEIAKMAEGKKGFYDEFNDFFCNQVMKGACFNERTRGECLSVSAIRGALDRYYSETPELRYLLQDPTRAQFFFASGEGGASHSLMRSVGALERFLYGPPVHAGEDDTGYPRYVRGQRENEKNDSIGVIFDPETGTERTDSIVVDYLVHGTQHDEDNLTSPGSTGGTGGTDGGTYVYQRHGFMPDDTFTPGTGTSTGGGSTTPRDYSVPINVPARETQVTSPLAVAPTTQQATTPAVAATQSATVETTNNNSRSTANSGGSSDAGLDDDYERRLRERIAQLDQQIADAGKSLADDGRVTEASGLSDLQAELARLRAETERLRALNDQEQVAQNGGVTSNVPGSSTTSGSLNPGGVNQFAASGVDASNGSKNGDRLKGSSALGGLDAELAAAKGEGDFGRGPASAVRAEQFTEAGKVITEGDGFGFLKKMKAFDQKLWDESIEGIKGIVGGYPGIKELESHLPFEFDKILPHALIDRFGLPKVVEIFQLEGKTFSTIKLDKKGNLSILVYGFNPKKLNYKELQDKEEVAKRVRLNKIVDSLHKMNKQDDSLKLVRERVKLITVYKVKSEKVKRIAFSRLLPEDIVKEKVLKLALK